MAAEKRLGVRLQLLDGKKTENNIIRFSKNSDQAFKRFADSTKPASQGLRDVDRASQGLNRAVKQGIGLLTAYAGLHSVFREVSAIKQTGMEFERIDGILTKVTGSTSDAAREMQFIEKESQRLGRGLLVSAQGYSKLLAATEGTNVTVAQTRDIFTAISEASTVLGMSADDTAGAFRAIEQIMSKGKVQAEELRGQLGERLVGAFNQAALSMGITNQQLDKLLEQGQLAADTFLPNFAKQIRATYGDAVEEASTRAIANQERLNNAWIKAEKLVAQGGFLEAVNDGYVDLAEILSSNEFQQTATALGENLGDAVRGISSALGGLISVGDEAATVLGAVVLGRAANIGTTAMVGLSRSMLGGGGTIIGLRMLKQLGPQAAAGILASTAAAKTGAVAMRGLSAALGLVGGPAGLAAIAAYSLYQLATAEGVAAKVAAQHGISLDSLRNRLQQTDKEVKNLTESQQKLADSKLKLALAETQSSLAGLMVSLKNDNFGTWFESFDKADDKLENLQFKLKQGELSLEEFGAAINEMGTKDEGFRERAIEIGKQIELYRTLETKERELRTNLNKMGQEVSSGGSNANSGGASNTNILDAQKAKKDLADTQKEIDKLYAEIEANQRTAMQSADVWRENALKNIAGVKIGHEDLALKIEEIYRNKMATAYEDDLSNAKDWRSGIEQGLNDINEGAADMASTTRGIVNDLSSGLTENFADMVTGGKASFGDLAASLADSLLKMLIQTQIVVPMINALMESIGLGGKAKVAHTGGVVGGDALGNRSVSPPKYHTGGIVGLRNDEQMAVLQNGEGVFTKGQMRALGAAMGGTPSVNVTVINNQKGGGKTNVQTKQQRNADGGMDMQIILNQVEDHMAKSIVKGGPLSSSMEKQYGLNRSNGAYR